MTSGQRSLLTTLLAWCACALVGFAIHSSRLTDPLDRKLLDLGFAIERRVFAHDAQNDVTVVGIDEAFLSSVREPLALIHRPLDQLFTAVAAGKPKLVSLDIVLPEKSFAFLAPVDDPTLDFDSALGHGLLELGNASPLFVGKMWDQAHGRFRAIHPAFLATSGLWAMRRGMKEMEHVGSALVCPDADGPVREYPGVDCQPNRKSQETSSALIARWLERPVPDSGWIDYGIGAAFDYLPAGQLIKWHAENDPRLKVLNGRIVLVGAILDNEDRLFAPHPLAQWEPGNQRIPGVLIQAQLVRSLLNDGLVRSAPLGWLLTGIALASTLVVGRKFVRKLAIYLVMAVLTLICSALALRSAIFLPPLTTLATATVALLVTGGMAGYHHWRERRNLERSFGGIVSPEVLKGILSGAVAPGRAGEKRFICVLFSDIRGFTTLSEKMPPDVVVNVLNRYFDRMSHIVHSNGGTVDKFIGDGLMALFGSPQTLESPTRNALEASHQMLLALADLNREFARDELPQLAIGIGLHSGEAIIGHIGSQERNEYTAIGDTVNVAARLCDLPKLLNYPIIVSAAAAQAVAHPAFLVDCGEQALKGHAAMQVYGWQPDAIDQR
jgi:class 3 adenylate cyclase